MNLKELTTFNEQVEKVINFAQRQDHSDSFTDVFWLGLEDYLIKKSQETIENIIKNEGVK